MQEEQYVKVLFRFFSNVLEEETVETMWAIPVVESEGLFKLESIPFYGPPIASDDIFFAEHDEQEQMLTFREVREHSGNSIVQVVIMKNPYGISELRGEFMELGCPSEGVNDRYFVLEIPSTVNYQPIKEKLESLELTGKIEYAEPLLSEKHST